MAATTYSMKELEKNTGVQARTLRHWIRQKLLPRPLGTGRAARYLESHLRRAKAIAAMRAQGRSLRTIRARLSQLSEEQLLALVPTPRRALTAEGVPQPPPAPSYPAVSWELVTLADGLVLMVNPGAGPLVRRIADEIYRHYSAPPQRQGQV